MKVADAVTIIALCVALVFALLTPAHAQDKPSEIDIRVSAMVAEKNAHVTTLSDRAATLAAELAATQAKLKAAEAQVCKPEPAK
jgi:hypothetical protein